MTAQQGIVLLDLEARGVVSLVFFGVVDVFALGAFHFDDDAIAFFLGHGNRRSLKFRQNTKWAGGPVNRSMIAVSSSLFVVSSSLFLVVPRAVLVGSIWRTSQDAQLAARSRQYGVDRF